MMLLAQTWHRARRAAARAAGKVGGYVLAEAVSANMPRILMYHRFARSPAWRKLDLPSFEAHLVFLREHYEIMSLDAMVATMQGGESPGPRAIAITVDDAYEDFHRLALPVLERHRIPATLFIPTDFVDGKAWLWPDLLLWMVRQTTRAWIDLERIGRIQLGTLYERRSAWNSIADVLLELSQIERAASLDMISKKLGVSAPRLPSVDYEPMTWNQVRDAVRRGVCVGSQACQHIPLSREAAEIQRDEAMGSLKRIEEQTGQRVLHFSYPHGRIADFSDASVEAAKYAGYVSASMAVRIVSRRDPLFRLPRFSPPETTADLELALSGLSDMLSRTDVIDT